MPGRHDQLRLRAGQVRTPVPDDPVGAFNTAALSPVSDDRIIHFLVTPCGPLTHTDQCDTQPFVDDTLTHTPCVHVIGRNETIEVACPLGRMSRRASAARANLSLSPLAQRSRPCAVSTKLRDPGSVMPARFSICQACRALWPMRERSRTSREYIRVTMALPQPVRLKTHSPTTADSRRRIGNRSPDARFRQSQGLPSGSESIVSLAMVVSTFEVLLVAFESMQFSTATGVSADSFPPCL